MMKNENSVSFPVDENGIHQVEKQVCVWLSTSVMSREARNTEGLRFSCKSRSDKIVELGEYIRIMGDINGTKRSSITVHAKT
ncbi:MAG: hypothetical protein DRP00_02490 [Candidatus Aenigmatarchaeota archaeon]|nr:MAG: hypothetical protein DRP00_02490 [Candidatus Aenigmarchaeota archaeon]